MTEQRDLRVTRRAAREIREAASWWTENRLAAPRAFREDLERAFELLSLYPGIGARARSPRLSRVRRIHLSRIGYDLYYRPTGSRVDIVAFWHASRGTGPL